MNDERFAHFLMLGQVASHEMRKVPGLVPPDPLRVSPTHDLAVTTPEEVTLAVEASEPYKLFFVFERYLRELILEVLTKDGTEEWWSKVPTDVQDEVTTLEKTEETKGWMALGSRDKSALLTYPQLLRIIDYCWKDWFIDLLRDKALIQEGRLLVHLRNAVCHMSTIPEEELQRIRQVMRDWFRRVPP